MINRLITLFVIRSISKSQKLSPNTTGDILLHALYNTLRAQLYPRATRGESQDE